MNILKPYRKDFQTPLGWIGLLANDQALVGVDLVVSGTHNDEHPILTQAQEEIVAYLKGQRRSFDLSIHFEGTDFQKLVWQAMLEIPWGETRSYSDLAKSIGRPKACRAVGQAAGKNELLIIVPCHRVITKDGRYGGFRAGITCKKSLLKLENSNFKKASAD